MKTNNNICWLIYILFDTLFNLLEIYIPIDTIYKLECCLNNKILLKKHAKK